MATGVPALKSAQVNESYLKHALVKTGIVASFMVGPAEVVLSDALFAKFGVYANEVSVGIITVPWAQTLISKGSLLAFIYLESLFIGLAMLYNKRLRGAYAGYEEYQEQRKKRQSKLHLLISAIVNAPYKLLHNVGVTIEAMGFRLVHSEKEVIKRLGKLIVDIGKTNTMSTTGVVLTELGEKNSSINSKRVSRLSLIFALCWLPLFIGIQYGYRGLGRLGIIGNFLQDIVGFIGRGLDSATTVNISHPNQTPIGTICILSVLILLAITGWRVANYLDQSDDNKQKAQ